MAFDDASRVAPQPQRAERDGDDASVVGPGRKAQSLQTKDSSSERTRTGVANRVNGYFGAKFHRLGRLSASRPWTVMLCSMLFCILCAVGLGAPGLKNEKRGDKLWVPTDTPAQGDKNYVDANFGSETRFAQVILRSTTNGANVLTPTGLAALENVATRVRNANIAWEGATYTYAQHCYKMGATCYEKSVLNAFANATAYTSQLQIDTALSASPLTSQNPDDGSTVLLKNVAGGITMTGAVPSASAISLTYLFKNNDVLRNGDYVDEKGDAFDSVVLDIFANPPSGFSASYVTERSFSDEFGSTIQSDLQKLQIALFLILAYAALTLSKWNMGCVGSRVGVTLAGIVSIGMAIASAYGIGAYCGLFFSPLMNVLPFLLLGIGVDDMFVIVNSYDNTEARVDPVERMGRSLRVAGMSITVTSATDVIAFLIGSSTSLPALKNFCFYAALGIFFDYLYQITFFTAFLSIDERRKSENKADCFFCLDCPPEACCVCCTPKKMPKSLLQIALGDGLGKQLGKKPVKIFVLAFFSAITVGGIIGSTKMQVDADVNNFIPDGSYLKNWFADTDAYFTEYGDAVEVYSKSTLDLTTEDSILRAATAAFTANPYVINESVRSWVDDFYTYHTTPSNGVTVTSSNYITSLQTWLSTAAGSQYKNDVVFDDETSPTAIVSTRIHGNHIKTDKSNVNVQAMDTLRAAINAVSGNNGRIFAFGSQWLNYEQYKSITSEAIRNISITLAACFVIIAMLVIEIKTVVSVSLALTMIFVNIVGYMHFWGLTIDSVTVIMLVIALGLAVDYSAHIGRAYLEKTGTPDERIVRTLQDMGVAVWNGAMSTFMAVLILGSSDSYVFQTFFKQLFLCIVLGLMHGLIFLPVVLSMLRPAAYAEAT